MLAVRLERTLCGVRARRLCRLGYASMDLVRIFSESVRTLLGGEEANKCY